MRSSCQAGGGTSSVNENATVAEEVSASVAVNTPATDDGVPVKLPEATVVAVYESRFTGGAFANFFVNWLVTVVSVITLTIARPAMLCWRLRWLAKHTYLNGRRLAFDGKGLQLWGRYLLWMLLSVITLGLYYIFSMSVAIEKWETKHTHFEGSPEGKESKFDGNSLQLFGVNFVCKLVTVITLSFGSYWAHCYKERWFCKHRTIDGAKLYFDGTASQYFGKRLLWSFLTVITIGIYSFWLFVKSKKWTVSHTKVETGAELPPVNLQGAECKFCAAVNQTAEAAPANTNSNTLGLVGLILAIVSTCAMPPLCIPAIICSAISLSKKEQQKGLAIAGLVIGILVTVVIIFLIIYFTLIMPRLQTTYY